MITEDFRVPTDGSWLGLPMISDHTIVHNGTHSEIYARFGSSSESYGIKIAEGDTIIVDETVYVRSVAHSITGSVRVTR